MLSTAGYPERIRSLLHRKVREFLGLGQPASEPTRWSRAGLAFSGLFLIAGGAWIAITSERLPLAVSVAFVVVGSFVLAVSMKKRMSLARTNTLTLTIHLSALFSFYFLATRFLVVTYSTDTIVATYAGLLGVLQLQNPYLYSIKPFLDQFGLPPSFYTPRVDGSFEFRLNYPAVNFLSLLPLYLAGVHDLRDGVLFFHVMSVLLVFGTVPPRARAIALAPFVFGLPLAIVYSWTDSVWAFLLLLGAVVWHKDQRLGLAIVGLAGATKQIALIVLPFLLVRLWYETTQSRRKRLLEGLGALLIGFIGPNLPFILSSPSSWWAGTVAAYLPGKAPQVAGGMGLSEILLNLGISPPSSFFIVLMAAVTFAALFLYARRFGQYSRLAFAIPSLILFFYYRSFPNYIFYWIIPLLAELVGFKGQGFPAGPATDIRVPRRVSVSVPLSRIQSRVASSALVVLVIVAVLAGVSGAYISESGSTVDVHVGRVLDTDSIRAATGLDITLTNLGTESVSPRFFVKWSFLPFLWTTNSSENDYLGPGEIKGYVLSATDARAAVPESLPFRVLVFNSLNGNLVGQSQPTRAAPSPLTIVNPFFRWWMLDSETGRKVPFGWGLVLEATGPSTGIDELDRDPSGGIQLRLNHTSDEGRLETIGVLQKIPFGASSFSIMTLQSPIGERGVVFGTRFSDGVHTLYYVFSQIATSRTVEVHSENVTITLPTDSGSWAWIPIEASLDWTIQGWSKPETFEFSLFLQATSRGVFYGYVQEIR